MNQLTHQHNILLQNITALETKIDEWQIKELEAQKIINELKQNTHKVNAENQLLQERLQDRKADVERLTQQLKHAQHNLEHYRDSIKQERDSEKHNYQSQINKLEQQLHQHQMNATSLQNKISRSSQHIELLESEKQCIKAELEQTLKNCHDYELLAQRHEINNGNLVINNDRINTAHNALADEIKTGKNIISGLKLQLVQSEERALILEHSLKKAEDKISLMSDRHIFLLQEKTELASQLKQILSVSSNKIARGSAYGQTIALAGQ